jgi:AcrR family transcriptional regulator
VTPRRAQQGPTETELGATTRELVRKTSTELFAERGYAATSMRQLADRAGLPPSAFYYYFRSKYEVLLATMDAAMSNLENDVERAAGASDTPEDRLKTLVARHVAVHLADPDIARVADGELRALHPEDRDAMLKRRDAYERHFREVLAEGVASGRFDSELDIPVACMSILTMATGVIDWWRPGGRYSREETSEMLGAFALALATGVASSAA